MELKKTLENFFRNYRQAINISQLATKLGLNDNDYEELEEAIYNLELEGKIYGDDKGNYLSVSKEFYLYHGVIKLSTKKNYYISLEKGKKIIISSDELYGAKTDDVVFVEAKENSKYNKQLDGHVVRIVKKPRVDKTSFLCKCNLRKNFSKGNFYVEYNNKRIIISNEYLSNAYINDLVTVQIFSKGNNVYGKVVEVLERYQKEHVFEYKRVDGILEWVSYDAPYFKVNMKLPSNEKFCEGERVVAQITNNTNAIYLKRIVEENQLEKNISSLCYDYGFHQEFSSKVYNDLYDVKNEFDEQEVKKRKDFRNLTTVTIDGVMAKDLDDAVSLEKIGNNYMLHVHIADVSHYVKPGTNLFNEAMQRGTSVYPANCVIPMLPYRLSNELCSLNPHEEKLAKTCSILIDPNGNILDINICKSIIKSNIKMSYEKVNEVLAGGLNTEYLPYVKLLYEMNLLSSILQKRRIERGFICFESTELEFDINKNGTVDSIHHRVKGPAQQIIENFMLIANEVVATYAFYLQVPFAYRIHEGPTVEQLNKLSHNLKNAGHLVSKIANSPNPKLLQKILLTVSEGRTTAEMAYISNIVLECMNRAHYSTDNTGHYGLALEQYATFTSPIRRFPDLMNHLTLDAILEGNSKQLEMYEDIFPNLCDYCSERQLQAENLERAVNNCLLRDYFKNCIGKTMYAKIAFITNDVVGVEIDNSIYGSIRVHKKNIIEHKLRINQREYKQGDMLPVIINKFKEDSEDIQLSIAEEEMKEKVKLYKKER